jgi:hypothetical protein
MKRFLFHLVVSLGAAALAPQGRAAAIVLYDQDFESPAAFVNDSDDINIFHSVNELYGNQPLGFVFTQTFTVETLHITGTEAFGTGYSDPSGIGGNYALGMLSSVQDDLLGLAFNVNGFHFLNVSLNISSIDLSFYNGPFGPAGGSIPTFGFTLYDNPSGAAGLGAGTILDTQQASGVASPRAIFEWSDVLLALDSSGSTNGNVILRIDLLDGNYASMDNFRIAASDTPGDVGLPTVVPESPSLILVAIGLVVLLATHRRSRRASGVALGRLRRFLKPPRNRVDTARAGSLE